MTQRHTHTYALYKSRTKNAKSIYDKWFKCMAADCTHFAKYEMVVGKKSLCNSCGEEYILDREAAKRSTPLCMNCRETKQAKVYQTAKSLMDKLVKPEAKIKTPMPEGLEDLFD